jgi:hypothetical protein
LGKDYDKEDYIDLKVLERSSCKEDVQKGNRIDQRCR